MDEGRTVRTVGSIEELFCRDHPEAGFAAERMPNSAAPESDDPRIYRCRADGCRFCAYSCPSCEQVVLGIPSQRPEKAEERPVGWGHTARKEIIVYGCGACGEVISTVRR